LNNDRSIGDEESELKYKTGIGEDVGFYKYGKRSIQKCDFWLNNQLLL
jgi:hypothetical protein